MKWFCPLARYGGYGSLRTERTIINLTLCKRPQPESSPYFTNCPPWWNTEKRRPSSAKQTCKIPVPSLTCLYHHPSYLATSLTAIETGFGVTCVTLPTSLNRRVCHRNSSFLQESVLPSLASGPLTFTIPDILKMARKFWVPLWAINYLFGTAPVCFGVLHLNTF